MPDRTSLSRRGLFRGVGTATLVTGCSTPSRTTPESPDAPVTDTNTPVELGPDAAALRFGLNGTPVELAVEPRTTLLNALRNDLGVTGPKLVCDRGACGACTVWVDGLPRNSCMMLAHDAAGREVTTVEGLARDGSLTVLQRKFVEHDALQCGFCTSGMLMSASAALRRAKASGQTLEARDVEDAISGNTCRCGTYPHVVAAVLDAAGEGDA